MSEAGEPGQSGLRNPAGAVRGVGAVALVVEAVVLLLAVSPLSRVSTSTTVWLVVGLAVVAGALVGMLGRPWAWPAGGVIPLALLAGGLLHWSLAALGVVFALLWAYVLHVRRSVLSGRASASGGSSSASE
jgi:hypothetical protein